MTLLLEMWAKFVAWISPILLPIVVCLWLIASGAFVYDQVRINGFGFTLPWIGHVDIITGYKAEAQQAAANYKQALANENTLLVAIKKSNDAYIALQQKRKTQDADTNSKNAPNIAALQNALSGKDKTIASLRSMVNNPKYGKDAAARAQAIIDNAYPGATP